MKKKMRRGSPLSGAIVLSGRISLLTRTPLHSSLTESRTQDPKFPEILIRALLRTKPI